MTLPDPPARAWQRMLSGRRLDLLNPTPMDIEIADIAHGLARVARWNGQTVGEHALSVAQHSMIVEQTVRAIAPESPIEWHLMALLHDAPEYVIGDLISPFKAAIGLDYKTFENRLLTAVHLRFGLPATAPPEATDIIKTADRITAYFEATVLAGFDRAEAVRFFGDPDLATPALADSLRRLEPWPTGLAQSKFIARFNELTV